MHGRRPSASNVISYLNERRHTDNSLPIAWSTEKPAGSRGRASAPTSGARTRSLTICARRIRARLPQFRRRTGDGGGTAAFRGGGQPSYAARVSSSSACAGDYSLPHADSAGTVLARAPRVGCRRRYTLRTRRCSPVCPRRLLLTQVEGGSSRTAVRRGVIAKGGAWGEEGRGTGRSRHTVPSGLVRAVGKQGFPGSPSGENTVSDSRGAAAAAGGARCG